MAWNVAYTPVLYIPPPVPVAVPAPPVYVAQVPAETGRIRGKYYLDGRGKYRIFNDALYRFYRDNAFPPDEGDAPFDTNASLPHTPADAYADGTWHLSADRFNGVLSSGFRPLGDDAETHLVLEISGGQEVNAAPDMPIDVWLEQAPGGKVRVLAIYNQDDALRADEWAVAWGTSAPGPPPEEPPPNAPDYTESIPASGFAMLDYEIAAQPDGHTVVVLVQTRRDDGSWKYSSSGIGMRYIVADASGPGAPPGGEVWPGKLPEEV